MVYNYFDESAVLFYKDKLVERIEKDYADAAGYVNVRYGISTETIQHIEYTIKDNTNTIDKRPYIKLLNDLYMTAAPIDFIKISGIPFIYNVGQWDTANVINRIIEEKKVAIHDIRYCTADLSTFIQGTKEDNDYLIRYIGLEFDKKPDNYTGYWDLFLNNEEDINAAYEMIEQNKNNLDLKDNQYLILYNNDEPIDIFKWKDEKYKRIVRNQRFNSYHFGETKPRDVYQSIAMDSLMNNQVTLLGGVAGSGKSYLALTYLFDLYENSKIDRIIVFCNPAGARNAVKLGFYPGEVKDKLLSTQVGHILESKIGDSTEVNKLIDEGAVQLIPVVDARGYEVPPNSGVWISEAQNLTSDLLRLVLQRCGEDNVKVIVDGDREEQLDMEVYAEDNGMQKMSQVFRGSHLFGQVDLQNIYRSEIARLAQQMR